MEKRERRKKIRESQAGRTFSVADVVAVWIEMTEKETDHDGDRPNF